VRSPQLLLNPPRRRDQDGARRPRGPTRRSLSADAAPVGRLGARVGECRNRTALTPSGAVGGGLTQIVEIRRHGRQAGEVIARLASAEGAELFVYAVAMSDTLP
jgi:hypothetical protein